MATTTHSCPCRKWAKVLRNAAIRQFVYAHMCTDHVDSDDSLLTDKSIWIRVDDVGPSGHKYVGTYKPECF